MELTMNIVIADDYHDCVRHLDCFPQLKDHQVTIYNDTVKDIDQLVQRFEAADVLVLIRERTRISAALLDRLPNLKLISQTGKISAHLDFPACQARGITVCEGGGTGSATAEMTFLLMLASMRHFTTEVQRLKDGLWQGHLGRQLSGKTLGVLGYGRIGEQVCRVGQAFGAKPLVWGSENTQAKAAAHGFTVAASRAAFFEQCDVLSIQLKLSAQTQGYVSAADLACMKPDALLVNTSRAGLIAPGVLAQALKAGRPGFAAVDVYEEEPVFGANHPLLALPNCLCTPHLGYVEKDNYEVFFGTAFDNINAFAAGRPQNVAV